MASEREIQLYLPLPPSLNHAYSTNRMGRRFPTKELARFKSEVHGAVASQATSQAHLLPRPNEEVWVRYLFYFPKEALRNRGWPNKAKTLHKKVDLDNRIKVLQDAVFEAIGIDDAQVYGLFAEKRVCDAGEPSRAIMTLVSRAVASEESDGGLERDRTPAGM